MIKYIAWQYAIHLALLAVNAKNFILVKGCVRLKGIFDSIRGRVKKSDGFFNFIRDPQTGKPIISKLVIRPLTEKEFEKMKKTRICPKT